jgi:hypothetical protein
MRAPSPPVRFLIACAAFGSALYVSHKVGVPHNAKGQEDLPGVALGWRLLFHVQRAGALLGIVATVGLIGWRGAHGEWPIKFGNVEYAPKQAVSVTADAIDKQNQRLSKIERFLRIDPPPVEPPPSNP